jgi:DNA-binding NarL/FixJ family response regulator
VSVRVLIVDDHDSLRDLFDICLSLEEDFEVVGLAADGQAAVEMAAALQPDAIILDWELPILSGLQALPQISEAAPRASVVVFSATADAATAALALARGATRFLVKDANDVPDVIAALRDGAQRMSLTA